MRIEIPVPDKMRDELIGFWNRNLGPVTDISNRGLLGKELKENHNVLYVEYRDGKVAGTCLLTANRVGPKLGAFGHVATDSELRRSGIATALCRQAVEDFRAEGGEAVLLGTHSPGSGDGTAARIYYRLGWRFLAGADVMVNVSNGTSPEEFLVDYFGEHGATNIGEGSAAERVLVTPLIAAPHDWQVLDSNVSGNIYSTRYVRQSICNGLYRQYEEIREGASGNWFTAQTSDGRVVGLASAKLTRRRVCKIDGFAHKRHMNSWPELILETINWASAQNVQTCFATVCVEDEEKVVAFEQMGFRKNKSDSTFRIGERTVEAVCMENEI